MYYLTNKVGLNVAIYDDATGVVSWLDCNKIFEAIQLGFEVRGISRKGDTYSFNPVNVLAKYDTYTDGDVVFRNPRGISILGNKIVVKNKIKDQKGIIKSIGAEYRIQFNTGVAVSVPEAVIQKYLIVVRRK